MQRACELAPNDSAMHRQFASLLAADKRWEKAIEHFRLSLDIDPDDGQVWYLAGLALLHAGQAPQAISALEQALKRHPAEIRIQSALAEAMFMGGLPDKALEWWKSYASSRSADFTIQLRLGELLSRNGLHAEALAHFSNLVASDIDADAGRHVAMAQVHEDMGNRSDAAESYRQALALRPGWATALAGLIQLRPKDADQTILELAQQRLKNDPLPPNERALLQYALGKAHDARGEYDMAMASWHAANLARREQAGEPQAQAVKQRTNRLIQRCQTWPFECTPCSREDDEPQMVFIVGMPRSGTTLTERIIATHPWAHGAGELAELPLLARRLWPLFETGPAPWDQPIRQKALLSAKRAYLHAARRHAPAGTRIIVDKAPLNFFNLWLAALLFPTARVVWCRRDPRDIGVSIYGENFSPDERLCSRLDGIGHYINIHARLMNHWIQALPLDFHQVRYETLVSEPETQARNLLEFVGLNWDPACLQFYQHTDGVQTPSRWQVREPIYTRSSGRWRHYQAHLAPLVTTLDEPLD